MKFEEFKKFKECKDCPQENCGEHCPAEERLMGQVLAKLSNEECIFITWMIIKARVAGRITAEELGAAIVAAGNN